MGRAVCVLFDKKYFQFMAPSPGLEAARFACGETASEFRTPEALSSKKRTASWPQT